MNVGATQIPSFVRILWTDLVSGFTQAASFDSRVTNPDKFVNLDGKNIGEVGLPG
jgi:hypothetical protein